MFSASEIRLQVAAVKSLCWDFDTLVDWVSGGTRFALDGTVVRPQVSFRSEFDAATNLPGTPYAALYTRLATKALLLQGREILRELNRSDYRAEAYDYPLALFRLASGQAVMAHCPEAYNRLELDDLVTGTRLTAADARQPSDFFFSRLAVSADGRFLLSAGWHWHPMDRIKVFNVEQALTDPSHLDGDGIKLDTWAEESSAAFVGNNGLLAWLQDDFDYEREATGGTPDDDRIKPNGVFRQFDLLTSGLLSRSFPEAKVGTLMPVGHDFALGFYEYPKLFDLGSGAVVMDWPHLKSGRQTSGIIWGVVPLPPLALDVYNTRFAVADETGITIVQLSKA